MPQATRFTQPVEAKHFVSLAAKLDDVVLPASLSAPSPSGDNLTHWHGSVFRLREPPIQRPRRDTEEFGGLLLVAAALVERGGNDAIFRFGHRQANGNCN